MKTIDDVRAARLAELIAEAGGSNAFATKIERSPSQVSQWANRSVDSKTGKRRRLSTEMCRYIETKMGKPAGWMDRDNPSPVALVSNNAEAATSEEMRRMVELMQLYAAVPAELRPRVFQAVRGILINLGGIGAIVPNDQAQ